MWLIRLISIAGLTIAASASIAKDYTNSNGRLSDTDFYRAVSCKATPKGSCTSGVNRWPTSLRQNITVSLVKARGTPISKAYAKAAQDAVNNAIKEINGVGANVRLKTYKGPLKSLANIRITLAKPKGKSRRVSGLVGPDRKPIKVQNAISASSLLKDQIVATRIVVAVDRVGADTIRSIVLEELVQSLGLSWDVNNPYYQNRSIFGQVGDDSVTQLRGQDAMALRRHYPR